MIQLLVCSSPGPRRTIFTRLLCLVLITGFALAIPHLGFAVYQAVSSEAEQEEHYNRALQAYTENRLSDARTLFEGVRGSHSEEAKKYVANIKAYIDAMQLADYDMQRSQDELDPANLDFAIKKYEEAIAIKSDGPWKPKEKRERAANLKARLLQQSGPGTESRKRGLCDKLLKASAARSYEQAKLMACALANDDPAYPCGGDEALHICQQMQELAKLGSRPSLPRPKPPEGLSAPNLSEGDQESGFVEAKAAFDANDFEKARTAFQRVTGGEKTSAQEYVDKIDRYENSMKQAAKLAHDSRYEEARAAYQDAAKIKLDGPGNPQEQTGLMALLQGVSEFYSGNYSQASQYLAAYAQDNTQKADIAHFYMGACELARFFLAGSQDKNLREDALNDFRKAKEAGFHAKNLEVSPKILKVYEELPF